MNSEDFENSSHQDNSTPESSSPRHHGKTPISDGPTSPSAQNPYNYIRFATTAEIDAEMPLAVDPQPDTTIRVRMLFKSLDQWQAVPQQALTPAPARTGFTLVEWGGVNLDN